MYWYCHKWYYFVYVIWSGLYDKYDNKKVILLVTKCIFNDCCANLFVPDISLILRTSQKDKKVNQIREFNIFSIQVNIDEICYINPWCMLEKQIIQVFRYPSEIVCIQSTQFN